MTKKQTFKAYALPGDYIEWEKDGFTLRATLEYDSDTRPTDSDCYSKKAIERWREDEWFFVGVVVGVSRAGVVLDDHAASLWGCECNLGRSNKYLTEVAHGLEGDAIAQGRAVLSKLIESTKTLEGNAK